MRYNRFYSILDINLLLAMLLLFGCSVGILYGLTPPPPPQLKETVDLISTPSISKNPLALQTPQQIVDYATFLIETKNVKEVAQLLHGMPKKQIVDVFKYLLKDPSLQVSNAYILELLLAGLSEYKDKDIQYALLNLLTQSEFLHRDKPILLVAAQKGYELQIPLILSWLKQIRSKMTANKVSPSLINKVKNLEYNSLQRAIDFNDVKAFQLLMQNGVIPNATQADQLLWHAVVGENRNGQFVQLLIDRGADINLPHGGYTLLAKAVEQRNLPMIQALIQAKTPENKKLNINAMVSPSVGTALQLAIEHRYPEVDEYLRAHGALEDGQFLKAITAR